MSIVTWFSQQKRIMAMFIPNSKCFGEDTLDGLKVKILNIWRDILTYADNNSLVYFFMIFPIDLEKMRQALRDFCPIDSVDLIRMYNILLNQRWEDFNKENLPHDVEALWALWKESNIFNDLPCFACRKTIIYLGLVRISLVANFKPQTDDDYWFLIYHLRQRGIFNFCHENESIETAFNLVGLGFNLNQLATTSGSLSTQRLMEIFLKVGQPINDEELSAIERIVFYSEISRLKDLQPKSDLERLLGHPVPSTGLRMKEVLHEPLGAEYLSQFSGGGVVINKR